ncbi:MAG: tetratricopeptide repeat protein, partial [Pseudomonadota bacterium]
MAETGSEESRLNELQRRWEYNPNSRVYLQLAESYRRLGRLQEAIAVLEDGLAKRPNELSGMVSLGRCRLDLGDSEGAVRILDAVVQRDPTHIPANKLLIETHIARLDAEAATQRLDFYRMLNDQDPEIAVLAQRVETLRDRAVEPAPEGRAPSTRPENEQPLAIDDEAPAFELDLDAAPAAAGAPSAPAVESAAPAPVETAASAPAVETASPDAAAGATVYGSRPCATT